MAKNFWDPWVFRLNWYVKEIAYLECDILYVLVLIPHDNSPDFPFQHLKRSFKPTDDWYENEHRELMQLDASNTKDSPMLAFKRGKTTNQNGNITEV